MDTTHIFIFLMSKVHRFSMESSSISILLLFSLLLLLSDVPHSYSHSHSFNSTTTQSPKCHQEERNALLEFKATFYNKESCDRWIPSPLQTWTVEDNNGDCCNWSRVYCDEQSGRITFLDLGYSCLSGSINSSSSIFKLTHLQTLDLSFNDFRYSKIPSAVSNLSQLDGLNLQGSNFSGQIPLEILNLTKLYVLWLADNAQLTLKNPSLRDLVQSLVKLELLNLDYVEISSSVPDSLSRLTSLSSLYLSNCKLQGQVPPSVVNLTNLEGLDLSYNQFTGEIFPHLLTLTELDWIDLSHNLFTGEIFPHLLTLTKLSDVYLSSNKFSGQIPRTISHLNNLATLHLGLNDFSGRIHLDMFFQLDSLEGLDLSYNNFSFVIDSSIKPSSKLLYDLNLSSCNLRSFPLLLQSLDSLHSLDLSSNDISGELPTWICDLGGIGELFLSNNSLTGTIPQCLIGIDGVKGLQKLDLSHNHLSGFEGNFPLLKWSLYYLDLRFNQIKGSLPIPSTNSSLRYYLVSNNKFSGELPMRICNFVNLEVFDIGNNSLSGVIPQCLTNLVGIGNLSVLNLHNNNFSGPIPQVGKSRCNLMMIDMSYNQLEGPLPRNMEKCIYLEFLNLGNNRIIDGFPFWLGKLQKLSVLILRSNRLCGIIEKPSSGYEFPQLQIIDLSNNNFTGSLPTQYFGGWKAMKVDAHKEDQTMSYVSDRNYSYTYTYTLTMADKGIKLEFTKVLESLTGVDLSSNNFTGEIPKSIATLKGMRFLNLSHNMLMGSIPFCLNGLGNLESLDLSYNKLFGEIPQQLTDLTTLEFFDVSFNQLTGRIPQSKQFNTFESRSYQGNPGLCGPPVLSKCEHFVETSPPPSLEKDHASRTWIGIDWKIVFMGYSSGFVIGAIMGMKWSRGCKKVKRVRHINFVLN